MQEDYSNLPLEDRPIEVLRELLIELKKKEEQFSYLETSYPHLVSLKSDVNLSADEYKIWQDIHVTLHATRSRIYRVENIIKSKN